MARGSGRTIPSVLGGGLARGTQAILEAVLERERRELEEDLGTRRLDITERTHALNRLVTFAGFLEPGTTLGDLGGSGMRMFEEGLDMDPTGLEDLTLSPETMQTAIDARGRAMIESGEVDESLVLPSVRAALGLEPEEDVAAARGAEARFRLQGLQDIANDPDMAREAVLQGLGIRPVTLTIPGTGGQPDQQITFPTEVAARIYAEFLRQRREFSFKIDLEALTQESGLVQEIQDAVANTEPGFSVSRPAIQRVSSVYNEAIEAGNIGPIQRFLASNATQGEKLALQYLTGSIPTGENAFLSQLPPQFANFVRIMQVIGEQLDPDQTQQLMESITEQLDPNIVGVLTSPMFRGLRLDLGGAEGDIPLPEGSFSDIPRDVRLQAAQNLLGTGVPREDLVRELGEDVVLEAEGGEPGEPPKPEGEPEGEADLPAGGIDPDSVSSDLRPDVQRLNTLMTRRAQMGEGIDTRGIDSVISRLRDKLSEARALDATDIPMRGGRVDVQALPETARPFGERLNSVLDTKERATGESNLRSLNAQIQTLERRIKRIIAGLS